jgi:hypothetical protein
MLGWLVNRLTSQLINWLADWYADLCSGWDTDLLIGWLIRWPMLWVRPWLMRWLASRVSHTMIDRSTRDSKPLQSIQCCVIQPPSVRQSHRFRTSYRAISSSVCPSALSRHALPVPIHIPSTPSWISAQTGRNSQIFQSLSPFSAGTAPGRNSNIFPIFCTKELNFLMQGWAIVLARGPLCGSGGWRRAASFKMIAFIS